MHQPPPPDPCGGGTGELDERRIRWRDSANAAGTLLDLGATAKARAADRCARRVHADTGVGVLINLGGDVAVAGPTPEGGWRILVQDTDDDPAAPIVIGSDRGLATSSTRRRMWWRAGEARHHIVDPRTGQSAEPVWRSVSVIADSCLTANTLSTAAVIRGSRASKWLAEQAFRPGWSTGTGMSCLRLGGRHDPIAHRLDPMRQKRHLRRTFPELLDRDDWGYPLVRNDSHEPDIAARHIKYAKAAVKRCPRMALLMLDSQVQQ